METRASSDFKLGSTVMASSRVTIGLLLPLQRNFIVDASAEKISVFEGVNFVGRDNITMPDKRVSRKHISLHGSSDGVVELVVEGPNPVIFKSGNQRRKLSSQEKLFIDDGDILELIPGNHFFKYVKASGEHASSSGRDLVFSDKAQKQADKDALVYDRNHQLLQDEALARTLQNLEDNRLLEVSPPVVSKSWSSCATSDAVRVSSNSMEAIHQFDVSKDCLSLVFRLMRVQGLPKWANECTVAINDVIEPQGLFRAISVAAVTTLPFWLSGSKLSRKPCLVTFWQAATPIVGGKFMLSIIFCLSCCREIEAVLRGKLCQLCTPQWPFYAPKISGSNGFQNQ